ncbi:MAG: hypothetical protein CML66_26290 [Rhodobacteraceae bacterium]|nr:hypothetical protein [Paracoccaceae bacterium]MAY47260.1 hypothetical protein [Paracoccaceae bacterium]
MRAHPDLAALLVMGGGREGVARALITGRDGRRRRLRGTDLTHRIRAMLTDGGIDMILAIPLRRWRKR